MKRGVSPPRVRIPETMPIPILRQGDILIVSIQAALTDRDLIDLRDTLAERVGRLRSRGIIIDVTALDVMDSFATQTLQQVSETARLGGARVVVAGIQPDVALAMVQLHQTAG
jgi:rsbT antagonist protein RsbS